MFITAAYAQSAATTGSLPPDAGTGALGNLWLIAMLCMIFYVLVWRPQQMRAKQHKEMVSNMRRGDKVITAGGLIATVSKIIADDEVELEIAEGVKVRAVKNTISMAASTATDKPADKGKSQKVQAAETPVDTPADAVLTSEKKGGRGKKKSDTVTDNNKIAPMVARPAGKKADTSQLPTLNVPGASGAQAENTNDAPIIADGSALNAANS